MPRQGTNDKEDSEIAGDSNGATRGSYNPLWNNFITIAGMFLAAIGIILLLTFELFALVSGDINPYSAIGVYLIVPFIFLVGVLLIPLGIFHKSWRLHRKDPSRRLAFRLPRIDFADPAQRRAAKGAILAAFVLFPVVALCAYQGYRYTDSRGFCTKICHTVMRPQSVTHNHSAHAQIACARCHMGEKSTWFAKSKLSGIPQVLAVLRESYPRPIPPAITDLRPTRDTCVECHWPEKTVGARMRKIVRFASDESNTRKDIDLLLKIGGYETTKENEGIHAHMALANRVEYVATDAGLQQIPWVRYVNENGKQIVFRSDGKPGSAPPPEGHLRQFDCMDCHNRPAHKIRSPEDAVDLHLSTGQIDPNLPFIKREAVAALTQAYPNEETAEDEIEQAITAFYRTDFADRWTQLEGAVGRAVAMIQSIRRSYFFPHMKVNWKSYPDNIGHMISPGCFRCHDGKHVSSDGEQIRFSCDLCHDIVVPSDAVGGAVAYAESFGHSFELDGAHKALRCDECHDGGVSPLLTCTNCHEENLEP